MSWDFSWLASSTFKLIVAGALGGVVRWLTLKERWSDGLISVIVGAITAVYVGPAARPILRPLIDFTGIDLEAASSLMGFLIGIGGILVSGFFIDFWKLRQKMLREGKVEEIGK